MIDPQVWNYWWTVLTERYNRQFSDPTIAEYLNLLNQKLNTDTFVGACRQVFFEDTFFPSPQRLVEVGRALMPQPENSLPAAPEPKSFEEMSEQEQEEYKAAIAQFRQTLATVNPVYAQVGGKIAAAAVGVKLLASELAEKRVWLGDKVLRKEALNWAMSRDDVLPVMNDLGEVIDFEEVKVDTRN